MKYLLPGFFVFSFGILLAPAIGFGQSRCESLFESQESVVDQLARLKIDSEKAGPSIVKILNQEFRKKLSAAHKSGLDLSLLSERIEDLRKDQKDQTEKEESRKAIAEENEARIHYPFEYKKSIRINTLYPYHITFLGGGRYIDVSYGREGEFFKHEIYDVKTGHVALAPTRLFNTDDLDLSSNGSVLTGRHITSTPSVSFISVDLTQSNVVKKYNLPVKNHLSLFHSEYTPDGKLFLAAEMNNHQVHIWDTNTQQVLKTLDIDGFISNFSVSNDGKTLVVVAATTLNGVDQTTTLWDLDHFTKMGEYKFPFAIWDIKIHSNRQQATVLHSEPANGNSATSVWNFSGGIQRITTSTENEAKYLSRDGAHSIIRQHKMTDLKVFEGSIALPIIRMRKPVIDDANISDDGSRIFIRSGVDVEIWEKQKPPR
jgi:WD40 repeat protein